MQTEDEDVVHVEPQLAVPAPPQPCPECGSAEIVEKKKLRAFLLFVLLVEGVGLAIDNTIAAFFIVAASAVFFVAAPTRRCADCGHSW
jgi:hypothetical protein